MSVIANSFVTKAGGKASSSSAKGIAPPQGGVATGMGKGNKMNSWGGGGQTISPKNATPKTTPVAVPGSGIPVNNTNPAPNQNRFSPPPMYNPPRVNVQMDDYGGNPSRDKFGQQTVAGDLFKIQGFVYGGT